MALSDLLSEIVSDLHADIPALAVRSGRRNLDNAQDALPRLVWIPTTMRFDPAENLGGRGRQIATRVQRVEVHCWHNDFALTEGLTESVQAALHRAASGSYELIDGVCMSDQGTDVNLRGYVIVFSFDVRLPVLDQATNAGRIDEVDMTVGTDAEADLIPIVIQTDARARDYDRGAK